MKALLLVLLLTSCATFAEPLAHVERDGIRIVLYDSPCALSAVTNLPGRVEWTSEGKTFEGCWTANHFDLIVMYFSDKTVISVPSKVFQRLQSI